MTTRHRHRSLADAGRRALRLHRADAIGRNPAELRVFGLGGTPNELVERIGEFADLGASTVYLQLLDLDDLDQLALLADAVLPQIE